MRYSQMPQSTAVMPRVEDMTDTPPSYRNGNDVSGERVEDWDFCYNTKLYTDKSQTRIAFGKPTGVYVGRPPHTMQNRVFCVNGLKESFDPEEAIRQNISLTRVVVPPTEEHDQDSDESPSEGDDEPAGDDLGY